MQRMSATNHQAGFSLVELMIAMLLIGTILSVFITALLSMLDVSSRNQVQLELNGENQVALDTIERDVRLATTFATALPTQFSDQYGPANTNEGWTGSWTYKGVEPGNPNSPYKVLILGEKASVGNPLAANRKPVFIKGFLTNPYATADVALNCTEASPGTLVANYKLPYYLVYFVRDNTLYRRTLTDTTTELCNGPQRQKQSCPRQDATPHTTCRARDEIMATNVSEFRIDYYLQLDTPMPTFELVDAYNSTNADILASVDNVVISLTMQKPAFGTVIESRLSVRVSRVN